MRQARGGWLLVGLAVVAFTAAGCREPRQQRGATTETGTAGTTEAGANFQDGWITTKVQAKYFTEPDVRGRDIDVTTNNGVVTLSGVVENEQSRQRALELARNTDGVVRVEDRLQVGTAGAVAAEGDRRLPAPATPGTTVDRQPGAAEADRQQAQTDPGPADRGMAEGDRDTVGTGGAETGTQVNDSWITTKIQGQYFTDRDVRARRIDVTTNNGVVTLRGEVENEQERRRATEIAQQTEGVRRVDDQLRMAGTAGTTEAGAMPPDASGPARSATHGPDDEWITTKIQSRYFQDDVVRGTRVDVATQRGVVTLTGQVPSEQAKRRAEEIARETEGASRVENRLEVNPAAAGAQQPGAAPPTEHVRPVEKPERQQQRQQTDPPQPGQQPRDQQPRQQPSDGPGQQPQGQQPGQQPGAPGQPQQDPQRPQGGGIDGQ
jgi:osmotically-inducible protein OsmY